jgi:hypothetical protein
MNLRLFFAGLALLAPTLTLAQGPAVGPDSAVLARLLERHRPERMAFEFAAIGDQQYGPAGERRWPALQAAINTSGVPFTVHVGDIKSGTTRCDNAMFANRLEAFNNFEMPMMLTPGDNEWTDCYRENNGSFDSLERLDYFRATFYRDNQSLGKRKMAISRQSEDQRYAKYRENQMWSMGDVLFVMVHMVGSNNNLGRNEANDREYRERTDANFNWIKTGFAVARDNSFAGVVLMAQANPGWNGTPVRVSQLESGMQESFFVIEDETIVYDRPVLMIMGDSHIFRIDKPILGARSGEPIENFTRLEVPGSNLAHWVRVRVDSSRRSMFAFEPEYVRENHAAQSRP